MAQRIHIDSVHKPDETIWFTLIYDGPSQYFVEQYSDSRNAFLTGRLQEIQPRDFDGIMVNNVALKKLVETKLKDLEEPKRKR